MLRAPTSIALLVTAFAGCEIFSAADHMQPGSGGGGASTGGAAATGGEAGTPTGGSGPGIECLFAFDCLGDDTDCTERTCVEGRCGTAPVAEGTPTSSQIAGDCVRSVCDGSGSDKIVPDDLDVAIDGNGCTDDVCTAGVPSNPPSAAGMPCDQGGGSVCDGAGHCVACVTTEQCPSGSVCVNNACVSVTCVDQALSPGETDIDCGGPVCPPCDAGMKCAVASDCASQVCAGNPSVCLPPSCGDDVANGVETDVDCGGGECPLGCGAGKACVVDGDCRGGVCTAGVCEATCVDEEKNLDETGVDCGGICPPCADGGACAWAGDCASHVCAASVCVTPLATCSNATLDGSETAVDCGGPACAGCGVGSACASGTDCASRRCVSGACAPLVLISEVRTRGLGGAHDEFVELYNPLGAVITLDTGFIITVRSAIGACDSNADKVLFTGSGQTIPAHGHLLLGGAAYTQAPAADAALAAAGLPDAGAIVIRHGGAVIDALCYAYDAATTANLAGCSVPYVCEGPPADNLPHDNTQSLASSVDASLERKPGGALGSARDTGDSSMDFKRIAPAGPESATSPPAP